MVGGILPRGLRDVLVDAVGGCGKLRRRLRDNTGLPYREAGFRGCVSAVMLEVSTYSCRGADGVRSSH